MILIADSDEVHRRGMADHLQAHALTVIEAGDAAAVHAMLVEHDVDALVLDVRISGEDGLALCRRIVEAGGPPVVLLGAGVEVADRVLGLELGAEDYLAKPLQTREVVARLKVILRRRHAHPALRTSADPYVFAGFRYDVEARQIFAPSGEVIRLSRGEAVVLKGLLDNRDSMVSHEELNRLSYSGGVDKSGRGAEQLVGRLRRKLHAHTDHPLIRTLHGVGYIIDC